MKQQFTIKVRSEDVELYVNGMIQKAQEFKIDPPVALFVFEEAARFIRAKFGISVDEPVLTPYEEITLPKEKVEMND